MPHNCCVFSPPALRDALTINPICAQLQFLPLVYADSSDLIAATARPEHPQNGRFVLLEDKLPVSKVETWGYSKLVEAWAKEKGIHYSMPPWDIVKMVNSKTFSFARSPLPGATLIYQGDPLPKGYVLKSCFGTAGRGLILSDSPQVQTFCAQQWNAGLPIIAEPFVKRHVDFSTQWVISNSGEIAYLGVTLCETTPTGSHLANIAGMEPPPYLEEQKAVSMEVLQEIANMGFYGEVGIDAMVYDGHQLQPIVEINARKTMGLITLLVQQNHYPSQEVRLSYASSEEPGPLPQSLNGQSFSRQVIISVK